VIGDILDEPNHWPASSFDTIILNGVFGFGLNSERDQDAALGACRLLLARDGWLVLGWNTDRSVDPSELPTLRNLLYTPLSQRWRSSKPSVPFHKQSH
jgi:hypothetical protein